MARNVETRFPFQIQTAGPSSRFIWFCERAGWFQRNHASDITRGLGKIQVKATQTGYFQPKVYTAVIDATFAYSDRPSVDKHNSMTIGGIASARSLN